MKTPKQILGKQIEDFACSYLQDQGLKFVVANYYCKIGEIDLIMKDKQTLVFVEVRYRKNSSFVSAIETIGINKQRKIIRAATYYMQKYGLYEKVDCRFDVIAVSSKFKSVDLLWFKDAFHLGW